MKKVIVTQEGMRLQEARIAAQEKIVKEKGKDVGAEAGISCDWHDNFGYEEARRTLEIESQKLKALLRIVCEVTFVREQSEVVLIGNTVQYKKNGSHDLNEVTIGAYGESDSDMKLITYESPLAKALIGMGKGDLKTITIVGNEVDLEVVEIYPPSFKYDRLIKDLIGKKSV